MIEKQRSLPVTAVMHKVLVARMGKILLLTHLVTDHILSDLAGDDMHLPILMPYTHRRIERFTVICSGMSDLSPALTVHTVAL